MSETITAFPLTWPAGWPRTAVRKAAKFSKGEIQHSQWNDGPPRSWTARRELTIAEAVARVTSQLTMFGVAKGDMIISTNLTLRRDGMPLSNQRKPSDPGAAVYWGIRIAGTTKVMAIDRYDRVEDNLAAIAATLDAMRAIKRHGGGQILERAFTGFTALPAPQSWQDILGLGKIPRANISEATINNAWRDCIRMMRASHPAGDHPREAAVNAARDEALRQICHK